MLELRYVSAVILLAMAASPTFGQSATDCSSLMKFGIYDKYRTFTTESHYLQVREFFKNYQFSSRQQAQTKAGELGLDIEGVLNLVLGGSTSSSNFEQWRQELIRSSYQEAQSAGLTSTNIETISGKLTDLMKTCLGQKGVHAFVIPAADNQNFTVTVDFVPLSSDRPSTTGSINLTPSSVSSQCTPNDILGRPIDIGPQGVSLACRRLATDTVTVVVSARDGSPTFTYDAFVVPRPTIRFDATRNEIRSGETTTLTWDVKNALRVVLADFGPVPEVSSREVAPAATTEYKLNVTSLDGHPMAKAQMITVIPPPPVLTSARVFFRTTDDNKDHNTNVTVNLECDQGTVATVSSTFGGEFRDDTDNGPFDMNTITRQPKNRIAGCRAHLIEQPRGDDEWHFNWWVELVFSDGSTVRRNGSGNVDSDRPNAYIPF
jgi:hypothetical protein